MSNYYIANCSCGKDSLAMVYILIELGRPLHEILFYDTGMEFQAIYHNWNELKKYAESNGIKCTVLKPQNAMAYDMLERPIKSGNTGYGWCGGVCRWGTTFKTQRLDAYAKKHDGCIRYIGIASDEKMRLQRETKKSIIYPLAEWGMTEKDCLKYCRDRGIDWLESVSGGGLVDLYDILDRVSCWCCKNKNLWELYNIWKYLNADYWSRLKYLQHCIQMPFKQKYSIFDLEKKFEEGYIPKHIIRRKP